MSIFGKKEEAMHQPLKLPSQVFLPTGTSSQIQNEGEPEPQACMYCQSDLEAGDDPDACADCLQMTHFERGLLFVLYEIEQAVRG